MIRYYRISVLLTLWVSSTAFGVAADPIVWDMDSLTTIGGHQVWIFGNPQLVTIDSHQAIQFDGVDDGLYVPANLLEGVTTFTLEILVHPDDGGAFEQRYFHAQDTADSNNRMLFELRSEGGTWYQDTFVKRGTVSLALIDDQKRHSHDAWHHVAATYDGATLKHYVDGTLQQEGGVVLGTPLAEGQTSLGVRQNLVSWYKGAIAWVRMTPELLGPEEFTGVPTEPVQAARFSALY
ncbi:LamG domain-containing protein [Candidatus Sumerlaeota bacterium]|nr:LamG domain-containing protein [Candidatus Sumerlaeota bacterium]